MKSVRIRTNFAIFVLFFGVALIEAFRTRNLVEVLIFLALGILSLFVDIRKK